MAIGKYQKWLEPDGLLCLEAWARDGLTDEQIANNMGISLATLYNYKRDHMEILDSLKRGKEPVDIEVENALNKKALGFKETIRKPMKLKTVYYNNGKREKEEETVQYVDEEIYIPPDVTAQIFWLKNRKSAEWRDKREAENTVTIVDDGFIEALKSETNKLDWDADEVTFDDE